VSTPTSRPRILLVLLNAAPRFGTANAAHELIRRGLPQFDFTVMSTGLLEDLQDQVQFVRIPVPPGPFRLQWLAFFLFAGIRRWFLRVDLVHVMAPAPLLPGRADLVTVLFSQIAYYQVDTEPSGRLDHLARALTRWLENRCYRPGHVRMFTSLAPGGQRELERDHPGIPTVVSSHVLQAERFYPDDRDRIDVRSELGAGKDDLIACFVNNIFWAHKGLGLAIEGFARARRSQPALAALWVVGSGPREQFEAVAREHGVGDRVRFLGHRKDIERIYRGADVLVHPARYETFSLAVHEAAASGLPVIATRTNGVEDLIEDGATGIMIPRSAEAVEDALTRLAGAPELRRQMGRAGRERALAFGPEGFTEPVIDAYHRLLDLDG
jgi:glycosyltransferase involved in cell wall biosynthesis